MVYDEVTRAYLKTILANKTVYYYSDAPYRWAFGGKDGLSVDDDHLLLKMMDKTVLMMNNMTSYDIAVQRDIDTIKNIAMLNVPINYVGEVDSFCREKDIYHYGDRPNPNWDFDVRLDFALAKKGLFSPLSFAVATKLFPIADVLVSRTDLDINGNHNEKCPHAIDFMDRESVYNGLLTKIVNIPEFNAATFQNEIMELINDAKHTNDFIALANVLKLVSTISKDSRFDIDAQKESSTILQKTKSRFNGLL